MPLPQSLTVYQNFFQLIDQFFQRKPDSRRTDQSVDGLNLSPKKKPSKARINSDKEPRVLRSRTKSSKETTQSEMTSTKMNGTAQTDLSQVFANSSATPDEKESYDANREELVLEDAKASFDARVRDNATESERKAAEIVSRIREHERDNLFGNKPSEAIPEENHRDMGGQFLTVKERIVESDVFRIAKEVPKGCHLHLHFNAELPPDDLIDMAFEKEHMHIRTTRPLLSPKDYDTCEIVFSIMPAETVNADIFDIEYNPEFKAPGSTPWMKLSDFHRRFQEERKEEIKEFIHRKLVVSEDEVYGKTQTHNGIWARFNQATRAFKGLHMYESAFRWYVGKAIWNMIGEKVMYVEMRPMLLDKTIPSDDGTKRLDHNDQMRIILQEVHKVQKSLHEQGERHKFPFGIKIIYCAPRSIPKPMMVKELLDCIRLKQAYPELICGFDLVGAEDRPNHIGYYRDELLTFVNTCKSLGLKIPFMFHAGETLLDRGGSKDPKNSNLYDALVLNAKRIGHGFALLKHPELVEEYKKQNICIELCPISNELLHLCRNVKEHPFPELLAAGLPCTINSDNPSLFNSSLSHEYYQVMVGSTTMSLYGWKQLILWSFDHSCLSDPEKEEGRFIFEQDWAKFCQWIIETYSDSPKVQ